MLIAVNLISFSLKSIGMESGARYDTLFTTMNNAIEMNASPIGVKRIND